MNAPKTIVKVGRRDVAVSNLGKIFYPKTGFTKGEMMDYYARIAPVLLPHLAGRPVSLKRYPDGVEGEFFYEKQCPAHAPEWIKTVKVGKSCGELINYCVLGDLLSLIWAANLANLELHPFQHQAPALGRPKALVLDLEPGPPADIVQCCQVALHIKGMLEALGLQVFAKTLSSGGLIRVSKVPRPLIRGPLAILWEARYTGPFHAPRVAEAAGCWEGELWLPSDGGRHETQAENAANNARSSSSTCVGSRSVWAISRRSASRYFLRRRYAALRAAPSAIPRIFAADA